VYARQLRAACDSPTRHVQSEMLSYYCDVCNASYDRRVLVDGVPRRQACYLHLPRVILLLMRENPGGDVRPEFPDPAGPPIIIN